MSLSKIITIISIILLSAISSFAAGLDVGEIVVDRKTEYVFRLTNGDIITGVAIDREEDEKGIMLKIKTLLGTTVIYDDEIIEIRSLKKYYRHNHRVYLLPTALPIEDNHFIGNYELGLFYGGFGISDFLSVTAGRSILPVALPDQQLSLANIKTSFHGIRFEDIPADIYFAVGGNLAFVNDNNRLIHFYTNATYIGDKSSVTAAIFYKAGSQDFALVRFKNEYLEMNYPDGSFGMAFGLDTKFSNRNDLHFIGEIWNSNINKPTNSMILLGLRLAGTKFSADFGLAFFTEPFAVPFVSFVWTPF